jgi:hypothetical protein
MKGVWHIAASAIALIAPWGGATAFAQGAPPLTYGNPGSGDDAATAPDGSAVSADGSDGQVPYTPRGGAGSGGKKHKRTRIVPYLEIDQTVYDQTAPRQQTVTYTTLAAGADMLIDSHRTTGVATIRYEHHFSETRGNGGTNTVTGIARTTTEIVPRTLTFDFGGLATHTAIGQSGGTLLNPVDNNGSIYQIWSLYGGPSLSTHAGILGIKATYNVGYNEIDQIRAFVPAGGSVPVDVFGHSLTQQGSASVGVRPGEVLPFGIALTGGYLREDMSNLDERLLDDRLGVQVTQPVSRTAAVVGDIGWEKLLVSQRNAVVDASGNPVLASNGQYITDKSQPRKLAYKTDGLTWDIGVVWKPSKRTMASAYVGQRYDSTTYYGSLYYAPTGRQTLSVSVFDGIYGYGSGLMTALQQLPTDFAVTRDPFSGNVGSCFLGSTGGSCLTGALGSAQAMIFHAHGVNAAYAVTLGRLTFNVGGGYIARRFLTAPGTVLSIDNGALDQTWYVNAGMSGPIDRQTRFYLNTFASVYHTDQLGLGDTGDWGVNGSLVHHLTDRLVGTAAIEVLSVSPTTSPDQFEAMGQLGLRYNFR